jgi:hypothetical protein
MLEIVTFNIKINCGNGQNHKKEEKTNQIFHEFEI